MARKNEADLADRAASISAAYLAKLPKEEREAKLNEFRARLARVSRTRSGSEPHTPAYPLQLFMQGGNNVPEVL